MDKNKLITDTRLDGLGITHGMTLKNMGHMKLLKNKKKLLNLLNVPLERTLFFKQVHKDKILTVLNEKDFKKFKSRKTKADGWIIGLKNCATAIHTADCTPLFLWDKKADILGLAHCGWRSIAMELPFKMAKRMTAVKKIKRPLYAFVAPHIKTCCFKVNKRTASFFPKTASCYCLSTGRARQSPKFTVDLAKEVRYQLISAGLSSVDIEISPQCTCCNPDRFFSYRRTNKKLSMMSFVYKKCQ
jgi:YfiH family protein